MITRLSSGPAWLGFVVAAPLTLFCCICGGSTAQEVRVGPDSYSVSVRHLDVRPGTPQAARRALARLDGASLVACGASDSSLPEVKLDVRSSPCWLDAMTGAIRRIGSPALAQAYERAFPGGVSRRGTGQQSGSVEDR